MKKVFFFTFSSIILLAFIIKLISPRNDDGGFGEIPYKGWHNLRKDGSKEKDSMVMESDGPFQIITNPIGHGN